MDASTKHPLVDVLDRQGGATVSEVSVDEAAMAIMGLEPYLFTRIEDGTRVSQGSWEQAGTLLECCIAVAARHPGEG
ncbi:MAG: hypothetical protein ACE366_16750 [Bradymonadia bacterium]